MKNIILILKGFIVGLANIVPGLSGGTMAIGLNIYEPLLDAIGNFRKNIKKNSLFLGLIIVGMALAIVLGSNIMIYLLDNHLVMITCLFIGLILGGVPSIITQSSLKISFKNIIVFLIFFTFLMLFSTLSEGDKIVSLDNLTVLGFLILFGVGVIASATMVIPGISGSFVLVMMGYYKPILESIKEFTSFINLTSNFFILGFFGVGVIIGIVLISKIMTFLFNSNKELTYAAIMGIIIASVIILFIPLVGVNMTFGKAVLSILMIDLGFLMAFMLGDK